MICYFYDKNMCFFRLILNYRIYSNKRFLNGRFLNSLNCKGGRLFEAGRLLHFHHFQPNIFNKFMLHQQSRKQRTKSKHITKRNLIFALDVSVSVQCRTTKFTVSGKVFTNSISEASGAASSMSDSEYWNRYLLLAEYEVRTASYGPSFLSFLLCARRENKEGKKRGSITCRTDRANETNKMFIIWLC